jgi:hypothetical protein
MAMRLVFFGVLLQFIGITHLFVFGSWKMLVGIIPLTIFKYIPLYLYPRLSAKEVIAEKGITTEQSKFINGCQFYGVTILFPFGLSKLLTGSQLLGIPFLLLSLLLFVTLIIDVMRKLKA